MLAEMMMPPTTPPITAPTMVEGRTEDGDAVGEAADAVAEANAVEPRAIDDDATAAVVAAADGPVEAALVGPSINGAYGAC